VEEGDECWQDAQTDGGGDHKAKPRTVFAQYAMHESAHEENDGYSQQGKHEYIVRVALVGHPNQGNEAGKGENPEKKGLQPAGAFVIGVAIARNEAKDADSDDKVEEEIIEPIVGQAQDVAGLVGKEIPEQIEQEEDYERCRHAADEKADGIPRLERIRGRAEEKEKQGRKTDEK